MAATKVPFASIGASGRIDVRQDFVTPLHNRNRGMILALTQIEPDEEPPAFFIPTEAIRIVSRIGGIESRNVGGYGRFDPCLTKGSIFAVDEFAHVFLAKETIAVGGLLFGKKLRGDARALIGRDANASPLGAALGP